MTITVWVTIAVAAATLAAHFINGYLQRKQMRQIELHRADPKVGLTPPPHPLTVFLRAYGADLLTFVWGIYLWFSGVAQSLRRGTPDPTERIVVGLTLVLLTLFLYFMRGLADRALLSLRLIYVELECQQEITAKIIEALGMSVELSQRTRDRLAEVHDDMERVNKRKRS